MKQRSGHVQQDQLFFSEQLRRCLSYERNQDGVQKFSFSYFHHQHRSHCSVGPWQWWEMHRFRKLQLRENYHFTALLSGKAFTNLCACLIVQPCIGLSIFLYIIEPGIFDGQSEQMFSIIQSTGIANGANFGSV